MKTKYLLVWIILLFSYSIEAQDDQDQIFKLDFAESHIESDPDTAFFLAKMVYLHSEKEGDSYLNALSAKILGKILFYQGTFNQASEYLIQASEIFNSLHDEKELGETYIWLGAVYQYARQYPLAYNYYKDAQTLFRKNQDQEGLAETFSWTGHYYEKLAALDSALYYQYKALRIYNELEIPNSGQADVYDNIGSLYEDMERFDSAYFYFEKAFFVNKRLNRRSNQIVNLNNLGDVYRKTNNFPEALVLSDSALRLAKESNFTYQVRSAYKDLSKTYALMLDSASSFLYLDSALTLYEEIFSLESAQRLAQLQYIYETDRKEKQIMNLQKEKAMNKWLGIAISICLGLVLFGGGLLYWSQRNKFKNNKKIQEQKEKLTNTEQELLVSDLKNSLLNEQNLKNELVNRELTEKKLREELTSKSQMLTTHTIAIIRKNNFLEELSEDLKKFKKLEKSELPKAINRLLASIQLNFAQEEDWTAFQQVFEEIHVDFFKNLKEEFNDLSPTELRLCALLKLNLNSRDIATIMGVSQDSLRVSRYRLRKKMQVESGSLTSFLMTK